MNILTVGTDLFHSADGQAEGRADGQTDRHGEFKFDICLTVHHWYKWYKHQRPKHVELIGIINKPLLLHLVGVYIIYDEADSRFSQFYARS